MFKQPKMDPTKAECTSLITWLETLLPVKIKSVAEICDGVAICQALVQISPENFIQLEPKIKTNVGNNWRLRVSNLKKINEAIMVYLQEMLNMNIQEGALPEVGLIGEKDDVVELGKLIRLVLVCAVNCLKKQVYITQIMDLEESVQQCIMMAIQQLESFTYGPGRSGLSLTLSLDSESRVQRLVSDLETITEAKEALAQHCHNLESQITSFQEEKLVLLSDNKILAQQIKDQSSENRRQVDLLNEEIFKLEAIKDDYRAKMLDQEKQVSSLQEKVADLQEAAEVNSRLKDEVDALSETADKVQALEISIASYKKKLEDYTDIKRQLKQLEEINVNYLQQIMQNEEELKKHNVWKNQTEIYKSQAGELQQKLDDEVQRSDKLNFLKNNLDSKLEVLQTEKERIIRERDMLREENEELKIGYRKVEPGAAMAQELTPTEMKERLRFLEIENNTLRNVKQEIDSIQVVVDDKNNRLEKLTEQNRAANQRVLALEAQLDEFQQKSSDESSSSIIREYKHTISSLQDTLSTKEHELHDMQSKHARYLEKVGEVAMSLDSAKSNGSIETIRQNAMKDTESKLMTSAYYKLSVRCHGEAVDERLALLSAGQGQTSLSRQRQPVPRKPSIQFRSK